MATVPYIYTKFRLVHLNFWSLKIKVLLSFSFIVQVMDRCVKPLFSQTVRSNVEQQWNRYAVIYLSILKMPCNTIRAHTGKHGLWGCWSLDDAGKQLVIFIIYSYRAYFCSCQLETMHTPVSHHNQHITVHLCPLLRL